MGESLQSSGIAGVLKQALSRRGNGPRRSPSTKQDHDKNNPNGAERRIVLHSMIEHGVLPKLLENHARDSAMDTRPLPANFIDFSPQSSGIDLAASVLPLAKQVAHVHQGRAQNLVSGLMAEGASAEQICLDLLQPAAQALGQMWIDDALSFADVTLGTLGLQRLMYDIADELPSSPRRQNLQASALTTTLPGEQHSFGVTMVSEFLRADGWDVETRSFGTLEALCEAVKTNPFTLLGLSAGHTDQASSINDMISKLRRASCNSELVIAVGGPLFLARPELAATVEADWVALDARQAAHKARELITVS